MKSTIQQDQCDLKWRFPYLEHPQQISNSDSTTSVHPKKATKTKHVWVWSSSGVKYEGVLCKDIADLEAAPQGIQLNQRYFFNNNLVVLQPITYDCFNRRRPQWMRQLGNAVDHYSGEFPKDFNSNFNAYVCSDIRFDIPHSAVRFELNGEIIELVNQHHELLKAARKSAREDERKRRANEILPPDVPTNPASISPEHRAFVMMEEERLNKPKRRRERPTHEFFSGALKPALSFQDVLIDKESYREQP